MLGVGCRGKTPPESAPEGEEGPVPRDMEGIEDFGFGDRETWREGVG